MSYSQKMSCLVKANLCGSQIYDCRVFVPKPVKRNYSGLAAKLGFSEHEFKDRRAEVALNDTQIESRSIIHRHQRFDDFPCRVLTAEWKVGILGIGMWREGGSV